MAEQGKEIAELRTTVGELKCTIEKVSARLETRHSTARLVENR